jgi:hypothetical protein
VLADVLPDQPGDLCARFHPPTEAPIRRYHPGQPNGITDVDVVVVREGRNLEGRVLELGLAIGGKRLLGKALGNTIKAIEARNVDGTSSSWPNRTHIPWIEQDTPSRPT